jgi:hypothetical protein
LKGRKNPHWIILNMHQYEIVLPILVMQCNLFLSNMGLEKILFFKRIILIIKTKPLAPILEDVI